MRSTARVAVVGVMLWAGTSSAEPVAPSGSARAATVTNTSRITARKLRHLWDQVRTGDPGTATCVEDKVARATMLVGRVERRAAELNETTDESARAVALSAIEALDAQRSELEDEANVCVHGKALVIPRAGTTVTTKAPTTLPNDAHDRDLNRLVMSLFMLTR